MARSRVRLVEAPPTRDAYFWMLASMAFAMLVGIVVLVMECGEYDWKSEPGAAPAVTLPKAEPRTPGPAGKAGETPPAPGTGGT